jgi:hypothetical protein
MDKIAQPGRGMSLQLRIRKPITNIQEIAISLPESGRASIAQFSSGGDTAPWRRTRAIAGRSYPPARTDEFKDTSGKRDAG